MDHREWTRRCTEAIKHINSIAPKSDLEHLLGDLYSPLLYLTAQKLPAECTANGAAISGGAEGHTEVCRTTDYERRLGCQAQNHGRYQECPLTEEAAVDGHHGAQPTDTTADSRCQAAARSAGSRGLDLRVE